MIRAVEKVDGLIVDGGQEQQTAAGRELEAARHSVFDKLRNHDFVGAEREVERAERAAAAFSASAPTMSLRTKAEELTGWADFVLQQYGWSLDPAYAQQMNDLVQQVRRALASGDERLLDDRCSALDALADNLPDPAYSFLAIRNAIAARISGTDPAVAGELRRRLEQVEQSTRRNPASAADDLRDLVERVTQTIRQQAGSKGLRCSSGHEIPRGQRNCPTCGEDSWGLEGSTSSATTGVNRTI